MWFALVWVLGMCCPVINVQYGNCVAAFNDLCVWFVKVLFFLWCMVFSCFVSFMDFSLTVYWLRYFWVSGFSVCVYFRFLFLFISLVVFFWSLVCTEILVNNYFCLVRIFLFCGIGGLGNWVPKEFGCSRSQAKFCYGAVDLESNVGMFRELFVSTFAH